MTNVTRAELEACAKLLGVKPVDWMSDASLEFIASENLLELARAAKLEVNYDVRSVAWNEKRETKRMFWPADGTEAECIIKASASVQLEREKQQ